MTVTQQIDAYVENSRDKLIEFLGELVEQPSMTGEEAVGQAVIRRKFESLGLETDVWEPDPVALADHPAYFETSSFTKRGYEGRPNVVALREGAGDGRSLAFSGHIDVVPVDEDEWTYEPWAATVEDGRMYGRGAADMKGGIAAYVLAYEALDACNVELAGDLLLQSTIEEEDGGVGGLLSVLERGYQPDGALIPEPAGIPNVGIASGGVMYFRITVPGKSAHAARGYNGVNAIGKAATIYQALDALDRERKARISFEPAVRQDPDAAGSVTNLNVGVMRSGDWPSTVPSEAVLECRIGWPPGERRGEVREEITQTVSQVIEDDDWLSAHEPTIEWFGWNAAPHELDTTEEIVRIAQTHAEEITGMQGEYVGGSAGLDERFYNRYYDIPCPTLGPRGDNLHGADEYVEIGSLLEVAKAYARIAIDWCGTVEDS